MMLIAMKCCSGRKVPHRINLQLTEEQVLQLQQVLKEFDKVLQNQPGQMELAEHKIETGSTHPVRLPPYRLPQAYHDSV